MNLILPGERYLRSFTCFQNEELVGLVNPDVWPHLESAWTNNITQHYFDESHGHEELTRKLYTDMRSTLVSEMLTKVDRLTMASGLEARVPFLDHHLVEWAFESAGPAQDGRQRGQAPGQARAAFAACRETSSTAPSTVSTCRSAVGCAMSFGISSTTC